MGRRHRPRNLRVTASDSSAGFVSTRLAAAFFATFADFLTSCQPQHSPADAYAVQLYKTVPLGSITLRVRVRLGYVG